MALMDPAGEFVLVCLFYAFVRCLDSPSGSKSRNLWACACGALLVLLYATRGLYLVVLPIPFAMLALRRDLRTAGWMLGGCLAAAVALGVVWWLPHRSELAWLNQCYLNNQVVPHSFNRLRLNATYAYFGTTYGYAPYLFRHTPVELAALLALFIAWRGLVGKEQPVRAAALHYLAAWIGISFLLHSVVDYSPSRYYLMFYPALAALAAYAVLNADGVARGLREHPALTGLLGGFLAYHLAKVLLPPESDAVPIAALVTTALALWATLARIRPGYGRKPAGALALAPILIAAWALVNFCWLGDWLSTLRFEQSRADAWLGAHLPRDTVLIGDCAPGLALDNRFRCVNVIPPLCNGHRPLEKFASAHRAVLILDGTERQRAPEGWWMDHYPQVVAPSRRFHLFPVLQRPAFRVGVYLLPPERPAAHGGHDGAGGA